MSDLDLTLRFLSCEILVGPVEDKPCSHPNFLLSAGSYPPGYEQSSQSYKWRAPFEQETRFCLRDGSKVPDRFRILPSSRAGCLFKWKTCGIAKIDGLYTRQLEPLRDRGRVLFNPTNASRKL